MKVIFLDKDGTLIEDIPYNVNPAKIKLYPEVGGALRLLQQNGYEFIVVSNQAGVAKGHFKEEALEGVKKAIKELLAEENVGLRDFYYCPHHQEGTVEEYAKACSCRKPEPGLLLKAARDHQVSMKDSWMLGDILNDVEAGKAAGCRTILVDRGNETEWILNEKRKPDFTVSNICEAALKIMESRERP